MKRIATILAFLCSLISFGQTKGDKQYRYNNSYQRHQITIEDELAASGSFATVQHLAWQLSSPSCYGCISFYWGVTRSQRRDTYGNYWFDIWFYSNSYNRYGYRATINLSGVYVYVNNKRWHKEPAWISFYNAYFYDI